MAGWGKWTQTGPGYRVAVRRPDGSEVRGSWYRKESDARRDAARAAQPGWIVWVETRVAGGIAPLA